MKTILSKLPGGPDALILEEVPSPQPAESQVLVEVKAVGVNYPDVLIIQDLYQLKPRRPFAPGAEIAGIVRSVGPGASRFSSGDRVFAIPGWGGMAEQIVIDESKCTLMPAGMPFDEAAALVATYGTSQYALRQRAQLQSSETLLVLGAAGGVGIAAVELGKALGAKVIAAASSEEKVSFAKQCGADAGIVYPQGPLDRSDQKALSEAFKAACGGGADVVYDAVGGDYAEPALRSLNWDGRFLVVGFPAGIPKMPLNLALLKSCRIIGVAWGASIAREPDSYQRQIEELLRMYEAGRIRPHISRRFPLQQAAEAIREVGERRALGKIVVTV